ncbi:MAG: hypothetical protein P8X50_16050 [Maritimibacter sp.]|jgi:hypothetical protein
MAHKDDLKHIRWLGGGSGAGKSVIAQRLASTLDATLYDTDATMPAHAKRCPPTRCPHLAEFATMSMDERWVNRTPRVMLETFHWFNGEGFNLILEDLLNMPTDRPILVEGFRLLPRLVLPFLSESHRAAWLLPTPAFRRYAFDARGSTMEIPNRTSDPAQALSNLLERDALFTDRLRVETEELGLHAITVDGRLNEDDLADQVQALLFT